MMAPFTLLAAAMTYYWPYARTEGSISAVAVIYGYDIRTSCFIIYPDLCVVQVVGPTSV